MDKSAQSVAASLTVSSFSSQVYFPDTMDDRKEPEGSFDPAKYDGDKPMDDRKEPEDSFDPAKYDCDNPMDMAQLQRVAYDFVAKVKQGKVADTQESEAFGRLVDNDKFWPIVQTVVPEFRSPFLAR